MTWRMVVLTRYRRTHVCVKSVRPRQAASLEKEAEDDRRRQEQLGRDVEDRKRGVEARQRLREENKAQLAQAKERRDQLHQERQCVVRTGHHAQAAPRPR